MSNSRLTWNRSRRAYQYTFPECVTVGHPANCKGCNLSIPLEEFTREVHRLMDTAGVSENQARIDLVTDIQFWLDLESSETGEEFEWEPEPEEEEVTL